MSYEKSSLTPLTGDEIVRTTEIVMRDYADLRNRLERVWEYEPSLAVSANLTNPTTRALEELITKLEGGLETITVGTGQAAITCALLSILSSGSVVLLPDSVYGPVRLFADKQLSVLGVSARYYNPLSITDLREKICADSRMIWIESPGSLTFEVQDIEQIVALAHEHNLVTACDNTWATPLGLKPLSWGVDMSIHSLSKLISGSSEVFAGSITVQSKELYQRVKNTAVFFGHWLSPDDAHRVRVGAENLQERLRVQAQSAEVLTNFLQAQRNVAAVYAPFLSASPQQYLWKKYFTQHCGLFSFSLKGDVSSEALTRFLGALRYFRMSFGWGGPRSLLVPVRPTRTATQSPQNLLRVYTGMTDPDILISDLTNALEYL